MSRKADNGSENDRAPLLKIYPNTHELYFRIATNGYKDNGLLTKYGFKLGNTYKVAFLVDSNRIIVVVNGEMV